VGLGQGWAKLVALGDWEMIRVSMMNYIDSVEIGKDVNATMYCTPPNAVCGNKTPPDACRYISVKRKNAREMQR
jgi:hypothetical protein